MRQLILDRLAKLVNGGAEFWDPNGNIIDPTTFSGMSDEDLLNVYDFAVGFSG